MFLRKTLLPVVLLSVVCSIGCVRPRDVSIEFPTPEPSPAASPLPKLELKRDAALEAEIAKIAEDASGKVGVAAVVLETGEAALLNADGRYPMQSVYKLPIAMAVMEQVRLGKLDLEEVVGVTKDDFVRKGMASALRDNNPNGGEFTIRELIRLALVESDGTASDVLMRVAGGPEVVQEYIEVLGIVDMQVRNTEKELGANWELQYHNYSSPAAASALLTSMWEIKTAKLIYRSVSNKNTELLLQFMADSTTGSKRLKGLLPKDTIVAHKTGTGGTRDGISPATNDIGIIYLPEGRHLAIAAFVADSPADEKTRELVIAKIAKAAYDRWSKAAERVQPANFNTRHTLN